MIIANNIIKTYGSIQALRGVSMQAEVGEIYGLIGADGAGKTSLIRCLATLLLPDAGTISVNGMDALTEISKIRGEIGYMPGRFSLYEDLTVEENLNFFATIFGTTVEEYYDSIADIYKQIEPFRKRRAGKLSGGMKQKLALCCALIHNPKVLFLDEPTTGVDPVSRQEFWNILIKIKRNICIIVSTPYMSEAQMCDKIAFMNNGVILETGSPTECTSRYKGKLLSVFTSQTYEVLKRLRECPAVNSAFSFGDAIHVNTNSEEAVESFLKNSMLDASVELINPSIEDYFMQISANGNNH